MFFNDYEQDINILLVDDNEEQLIFLKNIIKKMVTKIYIASSAKEALEIFKNYKIDVVFTDINMPLISGIELGKKIKELNSDTYICAISVYRDSDLLMEAFEVGFDNYITKPIVIPKLKRVVETIKEKLHLTNQLKSQNRALEEAFEIGGICSFNCFDENTPIKADKFFYKMFDIKVKELSLKNFIDNYIREDFRDIFIKKRSDSLKNKNSFEIEIGVINSNGIPFEVSFNYTPKFDKNSDFILSKVVLKDITKIKNSEKRVKRKEDELFYLLEALPDGGFMWNLQKNTLYLTPKWKEIIGFRDSELPNHPDTFFKRLHPNDISIVQQEIDKHLNKESEYYEVKFRLKCKDETYKWIRARGKVNFSEDGKPYNFIGVHEDLNYQVEITQAKEDYKTIFNNVQDMIAIYDLEKNKIIQVNSAVVEILGYSQVEFTTLNPLEISSGVYPYNKIGIQEIIKVIQEKKLMRTNWQFKKKNGETLWGDVSLKKSNINGQSVILMIIRDISEKIEFQKKLEIYKKIVSSSEDMMSFIDKNEKYIAVNNSYLKVFNCESKDIIGKTPAELFETNLYKRVIKPNMDKSLKGEKIIYLNWFNLPIGRKFLKVLYTPYYSENRVIEGIVVNIHDMTDWKIAEDKLKNLTLSLEDSIKAEVEKNREKDNILFQQSRYAQMGEMLSMIAHQWRQPLNALSASVMNVEVKSELEEITKESLNEDLNFMYKQIQNMSNIINDFMNFFKVENESSEFKISSLMEDIEELIGAQFRSRGIELILDLNETIVKSYKKELEHIIINLIMNARDAFEEANIKDNKILKIKFKDGVDSFELNVIDNAGGIPENIIDRIFEPYFTTKDEGKGTGIGLYMTKTLIEKNLKGIIRVQNLNSEIGRGAHFKLKIPKE